MRGSVEGSRLVISRRGLFLYALALGGCGMLPRLWGWQGQEVPAGIVRLFDGKSLAGWKSTGHYKAGAIEVAEGALRLPIGGPMTGIVSTREDLPRLDYELTYEAKRTEGRDFFAAATFPVGAACVTFVNGGWGGNVTGVSSINGADASENSTNTFVKYENETWYRFRIRVTGRRIRCWVDDRQVVDLDHADLTLGTRVESRACEPLGFATYRSEGWIRNVTLRPLTAAEVAEMSEPDPS